MQQTIIKLKKAKSLQTKKAQILATRILFTSTKQSFYPENASYQISACAPQEGECAGGG